MPDEQAQAVPDHVHEAVRASANLHAEHNVRASRLTKIVAAATNTIGRPTAITIFILCCTAWLLMNLMAAYRHAYVFDEPPFHALEAVLAFTAVLMTLLILTTQQHESRLSELRAKITLELAILSEQKSAKIIELLEALRRDLPNVRNTADQTAETMSQPQTSHEILATLKESRRLHDSELFDSDDAKNDADAKRYDQPL